MSVFREIPPTAGFPLYLKDLLSFFKKDSYVSTLESDFKAYQNSPYVWVSCSGTAGLYLISESLKSFSCRKTVLIPAYICPSVALAIKRAGLNVMACDINRYDFNFNLDALEELCRKNNDVLAIVLAHLGGIPADFDEVNKIAKKYGIFIVEDCAQSLGAVYKGHKVGTLGDFAFFSLARGKGLTIYEGGIILTNKSEFAGIIDKNIGNMEKKDIFSEILKIIELFGYGIFYRPQLFWFVSNLPEIFWNLKGERLKAESEYFSSDFPVHRVSWIRRFFGHINFYRVEQEITRQRQKAAYYIEKLESISGIKIIKEPEYSRATYPFLVLLFEDLRKKEKTLEILEKAGLGVSRLYTLPITGYDYIKDICVGPDKGYPGATYVASRQVTLSTSTFLRSEDADFIIGKLLRLMI